MQCRFWSSPPSTPPSGSPCLSPLTVTSLFATLCATIQSPTQPAHGGWSSLCILGACSPQRLTTGGLSCGTACPGWATVMEEEERETGGPWSSMSWCGPTAPQSTCSPAQSSSPLTLSSCVSCADAAAAFVCVATLQAKPLPFSWL